MADNILSIYGKVIDQQSRPLQNAKVYLWRWDDNLPEDLKKNTETDGEGHFTFIIQKPSRIELNQWLKGYRKVFFVVHMAGEIVADTRSSSLWSPQMEDTVIFIVVEISEVFSIRGTIAQANGAPIDVYVDAFDVHSSGDLKLGTARTNKRGEYFITYESDILATRKKKRADLKIQVYSDPKFPNRLLGQSNVQRRAGERATINLVIGDKKPHENKTSNRSFTILGSVIDNNTQRGIPGLIVKAVGSGIEDRIFMEMETSVNGIFQMQFSTYDLASYFKKETISLFFNIFHGNIQLESTARKVTWSLPSEKDTGLTEIIIPIQKEENSFMVFGKILTTSGDYPEPGIHVEIINYTIEGNSLIGSQKLDATGAYKVVYTGQNLLGEQSKANLVVRAISDDQSVLVSSPLIVNALPNEEVNLVIGDTPYKGISEFEIIDRLLSQIISNENLDNWDSKKTVLLANRMDLPVERVHNYIQSVGWQLKTDISPDFFYSLLGQGSPDSISSIYSLGEETIRRFLESAVNLNIIRDIQEDWIISNLEKLKDAFIENELEEQEMDDDKSSLKILLDTVGIKKNHQKLLFRQLINNETTAEDFWNNVKTSNDFKVSDIERVQLGLQLNAISLNHAPMLKRLLSLNGMKDARELAAFELDKWESLLENISIPKEIEGKNESERRKKYVESMQNVVKSAFPTAFLSHQWSKVPELQTAEFSAFFAKNPDFEFRKTKVSRYIKENPEAVVGIREPERLIAQLNGMRRLFQLIPGNDKFTPLQVLWRQGIRSAHGITRMGEGAFTRRMGNDIDLENVKAIYQNAQLKTSMSLFVAANLSQSSLKWLPQVLASYQVINLVNDIPDWEELFGSLDFCDCEHCRSLFSPAAYFVNLLQFLKEADAGTRSAFDELLNRNDGRRPDLGYILLSCKNTNTAMPAIDLVNEVLENSVVNGLILSVSNVPQTNFTSDELRANPEYIIEEAYNILREQTYPWTLPFDLWHEERKIYLDHLAIQVSELMEVLHQEGNAPEAIDRAAAYFGMTNQELDILLSGTTTHGLGTSNKVLVILKKSGLTYDQLVEYLSIGLVNPNRKEIEFEGNSCSLASATLNLTDIEKRALYRAYRLQSIFGWELTVLDEVIEAFSKLLSNNSKANQIIQSAYISRLHKKYKLSFDELLSWWIPISTKGAEKEESSYHKIFLNKTVSNRFKNNVQLLRLNNTYDELAQTNLHFFNDDGNLEEDVSTQVLAGINIKGEALRLLIETELENDDITFSNLSHLYRVASFSRAIGIDIKNYLLLKRLTQLNPIASPNNLAPTVLPEESWNLILLWERLKSTGFSIEELVFVLMHQFDAFYKLPLDEKANQNALQTLQNALVEFKLDTNNPERPLTSDDLRQLLINRLPSVVNASSGDLDNLVKIVAGESVLDKSDQENLIEKYFNSPLNATDAIEQLVEGAVVITKLEERILYVLRPILSYLSENQVIHFLADLAGVDFDTSEQILRQYLFFEIDSVKLPALQIYLGDGFLNLSLDWTDSENPPQAFDILNQFIKLAFVITKLNLKGNDLIFVLENATTLGWYNLLSLPVTKVENLSEGELNSWLRLSESKALDQRLFSPKLSLFAFLNWIIENSPQQADILQKLSEHTGWALQDLEFLSGERGFGFNFPEEYKDERWVFRLEEAFKLIKKAGVTASQLWQWNVTLPTMELAKQIRNAAKARYNNQDWLEIAPKLTDSLRIKRRNALRDYLLANHSDKFNDVYDLYNYFLMDPEVSPCFMTSRIVWATNILQLYVNRILIGLEPNVHFDKDEIQEWKWRKNYRVWEANLKVFLYAESYILPELRDDKTPFFQDLENTLLQEEVSDESVEKAYLRYLRQLDEVGRLEIAGMYVDEDENVIHIIASTKADPPVYYYRRWIDQTYFTAWEKVNLKVDGKHVLPVVYNRRFWLLWLTFQEKAKTPTKTEKDNGSDPEMYWEITLNWSEYKDGGWAGAKSSSPLSTEVTDPDPNKKLRGKQDTYPFEHGDKQTYYFYTYQQDGNLWIIPYYLSTKLEYAGFESNGAMVSLPDHLSNVFQPSRMFRFNGCGESPEIIEFTPPPNSAIGAMKRYEEIPLRTNYFRVPGSYMKFGRLDGTLSMFTDIKVTGNTIHVNDWKTKQIFINTPFDEQRKLHYKTYITPPHQYLYFHTQSPFFFEDHKRTFIVVPETVSHSGGGSKPNEKNSLFKSQTYSLEKNSITFEGAFSVQTSSLSKNQKPTMTFGEATHSNKTSSFYNLSQSNEVILRPSFFSNNLMANPNSKVVVLAHPKSSTNGNVKYNGNVSEDKEFKLKIFYDPYSCLFIKQLNRFGIEGLLNPGSTGKDEKELFRQLTPNQELNLYTQYGYTAPVEITRPREIIDFSYGGAYSQYYWEVFFHIPMFIADRLTQNQQFADAQKWYEYIFNPKETNKEGLKANELHRRYWKIKAFFQYSGTSTIEQMLDLINKGNLDYENQIRVWEANPFNPHLIARLRIIVYMKYTVMKYLDNLLEWADSLFRRYTMESVNEAIQLYILALEILGRKPEKVKAQTSSDRTFRDLEPLLDSLSNALVPIEDEIENNFSYIAPKQPLQVKTTPSGFVHSISGNGGSKGGAAWLSATIASYYVSKSAPKPTSEVERVFYFCLIPNDKMLEYWDRIEDRLFKIRNCMNIEGVTSSLALIQPPIDPLLLVKATAAGLDLGSALNELYSPLPFYRFAYTIQKALDFCNDVRALGASLLSALEKKDAEYLTMLRAEHELTLLDLIKVTKEKAIDEAKEIKEGLEESKKVIEFRRNYYQNLERKIPEETKQQVFIPIKLSASAV